MSWPSLVSWRVCEVGHILTAEENKVFSASPPSSGFPLLPSCAFTLLSQRQILPIVFAIRTVSSKIRGFLVLGCFVSDATWPSQWVCGALSSNSHPVFRQVPSFHLMRSCSRRCCAQPAPRSVLSAFQPSQLLNIPINPHSSSPSLPEPAPSLGALRPWPWGRFPRWRSALPRGNPRRAAA